MSLVAAIGAVGIPGYSEAFGATSVTATTRSAPLRVAVSSASKKKRVACPSVNTINGPVSGSNRVDLRNWKLTLPRGSVERPIEIKQPELATFDKGPWYTAEQNALRFRAPVNGVTTSGSGYPRSELREMTKNGKTNASWSATSGQHRLSIEEAITAVPRVKPEVVAGQIHDDSDDVIVVRLECPKLYVNVDGRNVRTLDADYQLGKRFKVTFVVAEGKTQVYYNDGRAPAYTLKKRYSRAYFKVGVYTQSNCSTEGSRKLCNDDNYGEVVVYRADVEHSS